MNDDLKKMLLKNITYGYSLMRFGAFAIQGIALPLVDRFSVGRKRETQVNYPEHLKSAFVRLKIEPTFKDVRLDPRFLSLIKEYGFDRF